MSWQKVMKNPTLNTVEKVERIASMLTLDYGDGKAMLYGGAALTYVASGRGGECFDGTEFEELWNETKKLLDKERAKSRQKREERGLSPSFKPEERDEGCGIPLDELFETDVNKMCGLGNRVEKAEGKLYVTDVIDMNEIDSGKLNILFAPPGCGKTTFIEGPLKRYAEYFSGGLLHLAPTHSIVDSMKMRGKKRTIHKRNGEEVVIWEQEGIKIMTYASFAHQIAQARNGKAYCNSDWWCDDALICLDELDALVRFSQFPGDTLHKMAIGELLGRCENPNNTVIMFSATPRAAIDCFFLWNKVPINIIKSVCGLEGYKNHNIVEYNEIDNLLMSVDPTKRGMIYVRQIAEVKRFVEILNGRGIRAVGIWSLDAEGQPMDDEQLRVREALVKDEMIAEGVQVLVFNASYEAGVNVKPEKSHVDYVIVHNSNPDCIVQARGRYRGDLDVLYRKIDPDKLREDVREIDAEVLRPYLGKRLRTAEKNEIRNALNFRNDKGRLMSWTDLVKHIRANEYLVKEKKSGGERYWLIQEMGK